MFKSNSYKRASVASLSLSLLILSTTTAFATDGVASGTPSTSTVSADQLASLQASVDAAKLTYSSDQSKLKKDKATLLALQQQYAPDLKNAIVAALVLANPTPTARPSDSPIPTPIITPASSVDPVAVKAASDAIKAAYLAVNNDRTAISNAEKASKASPTDATLLAALTAARAQYATDSATYNSAVQAYKTLVGTTPNQAPTAPVAPQPTSTPTTNFNNNPAVLAAQTLVAKDYAALNVARTAVSNAEKASKAAPTDATLLAALTAARSVATQANATFVADQNALATLIKSLVPSIDRSTVGTQPLPPVKKDNPTHPTDVAHPSTVAGGASSSIIEATTKTFTASHPDLQGAVDAVNADTQALNNDEVVLNQATKALSQAQGNKSGTGFGGTPPRPAGTPPVPASSPSTNSAAVQAAYLALQAASSVVASDRTATSSAESASKASPTDATLLAALASARAKYLADYATYNTALQTYKNLTAGTNTPTP